MIMKSIQTWKINRDIAKNAIDDTVTRTRPGLPHGLFELTPKLHTIPYNSGKFC
jgi:hypothetical protein